MSKPISRRAGLLVVQVDGLSLPLLRELLAEGRMPVLAGLLEDGALTLDGWTPLLPPCTPASQAGILHGTNDGIPGFRWYEKTTRRLMVANRPEDAAELERRLSNGRGLLAADGSSIGNLLSGDAPSTHMTLATIDEAGEGWLSRLRHGTGPYPLDPLVYVEIGLAVMRDLTREGLQVIVARDGSSRPRDARSWRAVVTEVLSAVPLRILSAALVIREMRRGRDVIYVDFTAHDEVAHAHGPRSREARSAAADVDRSLGRILRAARSRRVRRPYRLVLLSDHGQSWGPTFSENDGIPLERLIARLMGGGTAYHGATLPVEYGDSIVRLAGHLGRLLPIGRLLPRAAERGRRYRSRTSGAEARDPAQADVVVAASGNLALVAFPQVPGRLDREEIERRWPGLIEGILRRAGIAFVAVRTGEGTLAIGRHGNRLLESGRVGGEDPLALFGSHAVEALVRLAAMEHVGDLLVIGAFDPASGEVVSFEELAGTHGGLGGWQDRPFIARPPEWPLPSEPLVGAPALYGQLLTWMAALELAEAEERARST